MKKRDFNRRKTRLIVKQRKRRRGKTISNETTGKRVKTRDNRNNRFRTIGKPGRGTIQKNRANKGTIKQRKRFLRGAPGKRRNRFKSKKTRNGARAQARDMRGKRESTIKSDAKKGRSRTKRERETR